MANGILDFLKTPEGQGLLAFGFGGLSGARPGAPLNTLGRAGLAGLAGYGGAIEREQMQKQMQAQQGLRDLQMQQLRTTMEAEQRKRAALPTLFQGGVTPGRVDVPEVGGVPMFSQAKVAEPSMQTEPTLNWQAGLAAGYSPSEIQALAGLQNIGKQEIARTVEVEGPQGQKLVQGLDKFGRAVGQPMPAYMAPVQVDTGRGVQFVKPSAGMQIPKQPSFADEVAMGNLGLSRQRLAFDISKESKPQFNADVGGWIMPPTKENPQGAVIPVAGGGSLKPPTEGQGKAVLFGARIAEANQIFDNLEKQGFVTPSYAKGAAESVPFIGGMLGRAASVTPLVSAQEQQLEQAQRNFINAVLRRESGAVIADSEFENARKQYFPQFGDSAEVIAQKRKNRETALRGITYEAGPHAKAINQIIGGQGNTGGWSAVPVK